MTSHPDTSPPEPRPLTPDEMVEALRLATWLGFSRMGATQREAQLIVNALLALDQHAKAMALAIEADSDVVSPDADIILAEYRAQFPCAEKDATHG